MKKFINGKVLLTLFIITNAVYLTMVLWSLPKLVEYSGGLKAFDMRPAGYSVLEAMTLLSSMGSEGIYFYKKTQLILDLFYPLGFILTYALGCLWVFEKIGSWKVVGKLGALASFIAGIADYIENFFIFRILENYPQISEDIVFNANVSTLTKSIATSIAMTIFLLAFLVLVFSVLRNRLRKESFL